MHNEVKIYCGKIKVYRKKQKNKAGKKRLPDFDS